MKHVFLTAILLLASLSVLPSASADAAVEGCSQEPGYRQCDADVGPCRVDERYYQHDAFFTTGVGCVLGNAHCGYYSHSVYGYWTGYDCEYIGPSATTASSEPVDCHGPLDGYQYCEVVSGDCHGGETYLMGDVHAHAECQPTDGKSRCGVDAYANDLTGLAADYHCMGSEGQLLPLGVHAAAAPPCAVDHEVAPGFYNVDVDCDPLVNCHLNNIEDSLRSCDSATAGCAEDALGVHLGTQYTAQCHDDACASLRGLATQAERCVVPEGVSLPAAAASSDAGSGCQRYPGYERCDYSAGPCTVTTYYYFHDAIYRVDGPRCDKPATTTASSADAGACQQYPGYERCEYGTKPCTVTTTHYYHDAHTVVEVCGLVVINPTDSAAASSSDAGTPCREYPGYERCDYSAGPCTVTTYYFYHDAFYAVDGPNCDKPTVRSCQEQPGYEQCDYTVGPCTLTTYYFYHDAFYAVDGPTCAVPASAPQPAECHGLDGLLTCEVTAEPCHAGFRYERGEVEDVHAQCFS